MSVIDNKSEVGLWNDFFYRACVVYMRIRCIV
jgi:hypothetical protein